MLKIALPKAGHHATLRARISRLRKSQRRLESSTTRTKRDRDGEDASIESEAKIAGTA